jgi:hypothetical protein
VKVQAISYPAIGHRDYQWSTVEDYPDMGNQVGIQNAVEV